MVKKIKTNKSDYNLAQVFIKVNCNLLYVDTANCTMTELLGQ